MAAAGRNIRNEIQQKSRALFKNLYPLMADFFSEDILKKNAAEGNVQALVGTYHEFLQSLQSANPDKFKLAVDALDAAWWEDEEERQFTFHMLCRMIQHAEQQLNQALLLTALKEKVSQILISNLGPHNYDFFNPDSESEGIRNWVKICLENYYSVCPQQQDFAEAVNLFRSAFEAQKPNLGAMIYYADQQLGRRGDESLSAELISQGLITQEKIDESLETLTEPSNHNQGFDVDDESGCLGAVIDDMSPEAQLGAAFCLFAVGALTATAGVLLALVLVHSIIPSLGITSPIAIGGCVAAAVGVVSGVALMGVSIKMAQNAFALFPSPDEVEKPSTQSRNCLRHFLC